MHPSDDLRFSIITPVYNRPGELGELLESLTRQTRKDFEVVAVDDGSILPCRAQADYWSETLQIQYHWIERSGAGTARNYGCQRASGNYFIILDSDCVLPPTYVEEVGKALRAQYADAFGGPEQPDEHFSTLQQATSYAMSSFWTTGGVRGGDVALSRFHPRSFNMGFSKAVFEATGGFSSLPVGEDIDLSLRVEEKGFATRLIPGAVVFHKRNVGPIQFIRRVCSFGAARAMLSRLHPGSFRWVYAFPALCTAAGALLLALALAYRLPLLLLPLGAYALLLFIHASIQRRSVGVGSLSALLGCTQVIGYGLGFMVGLLRRTAAP